MIDYAIFLEALGKGTVERRTSSASGEVSLWQDGVLISGTGSQADIIETIVPEPVFVLCGAGHIGKAVYDLARLSGIRTIILDDRPEMAADFRQAEVHIGPFPEILQKEYHPLPCYIIFTHGHAYDLECLRCALSHPAAYIGMIGSARKVAAQFSILRSEGFSNEMLARVHAPIGLKINAVTPEEIAISIMAEIISVLRRDKKAIRISTELLQAMATEDGIEVRIIAKEGSSPQEAGATMFVMDDSAVSTIGGGDVERIAMERARKMLRDGEETAIERYDLTGKGNTAMICGGVLTMLFSRVRH